MQPRCRVGSVLACAAALLPVAAGARAQCEGRWLPADITNGLGYHRGAVAASTLWDPDGSGPQPEVLVAAGSFRIAECGPANAVATWDGTRWQTLGEGLPGAEVRAVTVYNGELIATGWFRWQAGAPVSRTWRWSPPNWVPMGPGEPETYALAVHQGQLYAGGDGVRRWTGTAWEPVPQGPNYRVYALVSYRNELVAGGNFTVAGGNLASCIASWNGQAWHALSSELTGFTGTPFGGPLVHTLAVVGEELLAGGAFLFAGGQIAGSAARWNGSAWTPLGGGATYAFASFHGELIATGAGWDGQQGGRYVPEVRVLRNGQWESLSPWYIPPALSANPGQARSATAYGDLLYVGGYFSRVGNASAWNMAAWNGTDQNGWEPVGGPDRVGPWGYARAAVQFDGRLVLGGDFLALAGNLPAGYVAGWNGATWNTYAGGLNNLVRALAVFNGELVAGGDFTARANNTGTLSRIARWSDSEWKPMGGFGSPVRMFAQVNGVLYAVGGAGFPPFVSRWNGAVWQPIVSGLSGDVFDIVPMNGSLVVGGSFTRLGNECSSCSSVARFDPVTQQWTPLGTGVTGTVYALAIDGDDLVVGGNFVVAGGVAANNVARWNPALGWRAMGSLRGDADDVVNDFEVYDGRVYAAGDFTTANGVVYNSLARWNPDVPSGGAWESMGAPGPSMFTFLYTSKNELIAVGGVDGDTTFHVSSWLRYTTTNSPWLAIQPVGQPGVCGGSAVFTTAAATGYESAGFQWRRNGYNLVDGPTPSGSVISGSRTATLTIANTTWYDAADYTCLLYNSCGSDLSRPATLSLCRVDVDCNARVEPADLSAFINIWFGALTSGSPLGDFDQDSAVTAADLSAFVNAWFAAVGGTCP